jgi:cobalt-zinc-cadmium efflux system outer membrane protein
MPRIQCGSRSLFACENRQFHWWLIMLGVMYYLCDFKYLYFLLLAVTLRGAEGFAAESDANSKKASPTLSESTAFTLEKIIALALAHNPELQASKGRIQAAAGRADQAGRWSNPELELTSEDWPVNRGGISQAQNMIGASQTVPFPGKKRLDRQIGAAAVRATESELELFRIELVRDVKVAFYKALAAERLVLVSTELVRVAESAAETARKRVEAGAAADQELLRAEIPLEQTRSELSGWRRELALARQTLSRLAGRSDLTEAPILGALAEAADLKLPEQGTDRWLLKHPSMVAARLAGDRARLELRRSRLEPYPDVTAGVAGGREGGSDSSIVQFRLSLPLPIIDRFKGKQSEARANVSIAQSNEKGVEQRLLTEWHQARKRFETALEQATRYHGKILPKADAALRLVETGFQEGKFGFIDWLDIQRTAAEARLAYEQKLLELNVAQAELEAFLVPSVVTSSTGIAN